MLGHSHLIVAGVGGVQRVSNTIFLKDDQSEFVEQIERRYLFVSEALRQGAPKEALPHLQKS